MRKMDVSKNNAATNSNRIIIFILLLIVVGQSTVDIYLPSLPAMVSELHTTTTLVQLTLTAFLVGFSVSQLVYGPLSDKYGRKPMLLIGFSIYAIGSLVCTFAPNIDILFLGRLLQGLGVGAASTMSRAISRDLFDGPKLAKISAYTAMAWATVPIVAPLLGSYVQTYLGWRYNFATLSVAALIFITLTLFVFPETHPKESRHNSQSALQDYTFLISSQTFLKYILCVMIFYGVIASFNLAGPFLLQNIFGQSVVAYGWWIVLVASGYIMGSFASSRLVEHLPINRMIIIGMIGFLLSTIVMFVLALLKIHSLLILVIPMFFVLMSIGLVYPLCISESLSPFPKIAGSAGALFGFMVFMGGTIASTIMSHLPEHNVIPLALDLLVLSILVLLVYCKVGGKTGEFSIIRDKRA